MRTRTIAIVTLPVLIVVIALLCLLAIPGFYYGNMAAVLVLNIKPKEKEVIGAYKAETNQGTATLFVRPDHTFSETVSPINLPQRTVSGTWARSNIGTVGFSTMFTPYIGVLHDKFEDYSYGTPVFEKNVLGHISIEEDPDWGIFFYKEKSR